MTLHPVSASPAGLDALRAFPTARLGSYPTPVEAMDRLRAAAGLPQRLLVKRDDAIPFAFGGNKVRKLRYVMPALAAEGADLVITCGGVQSNHARATAAACAVSGLACHLVVNGEPPVEPTANALLIRLLGATVEYVAGRDDRAPAMARAAERLRREGRRPAVVPLGASTPLGALGFVAAIGELVEQGVEPDVIVHACSSGGTTAGLVAGCRLHGLRTRVLGVSADDPPAAVGRAVRAILSGMEPLLETEPGSLAGAGSFAIDADFVGPDYGVPTAESIAAQGLAARHEALFVDHTYTAKAVAGLIAHCRDRRIPPEATVLFWHTGGQVGLFA